MFQMVNTGKVTVTMEMLTAAFLQTIARDAEGDPSQEVYGHQWRHRWRRRHRSTPRWRHFRTFSTAFSSPEFLSSSSASCWFFRPTFRLSSFSSSPRGRPASDSGPFFLVLRASHFWCCCHRRSSRPRPRGWRSKVSSIKQGQWTTTATTHTGTVVTASNSMPADRIKRIKGFVNWLATTF